ncbi:nitric oxide reductase transcriptional regulator NorR [Planctobacterium marinum]|uniref:nitric oxide reductase transcriptional regulator NorR n=1 Tax=Planctobacterium marinum TaxID=1631968 RepID=UPI001E45DEE2|nr:nitric oxide reductase transcriptional regulator NorR [Planctobacterium marinum]MCC2606738.1 nitric oxide reductase transcriptional regulator NorR [Planctobacterium marinum]
MELTSETLLDFATAQVAGLTNHDRFEQLLDTLAGLIVCDAIVLLAIQGETLKPLAQKGLTHDTLGRRFSIAAHPRFTAIVESQCPVRFAADSPLPDPYDGLLTGHKGNLPIHACMGIPLFFAKSLIGVLTFDSLTPSAFDDLPENKLQIISAIAASTLKIALMLDELEFRNARSHLLVAELNHESLAREGHEIIGESPVMKKLKKEISLVAASPFSVLILGETGVGKELIAKHLHLQSSRANEPLVYVNCAALPENLIESELFGHVKGAFTGADKDRAGKFLLADGGTLFLDEIGEMPLSAQSKLLRALQSNEIQPVGQDTIQHVNVRVLAATNRDLASEVGEGRFRADLYHRLSVYPIQVPPLRQRIDDIALLAGFFVEQSRRKLGLKQLNLGSRCIAYLNQYQWPGNVRELEHVISRAALKAAYDQHNLPFVTINPEHCGDLSSHKIADAPEVASSSETTPDAAQLPMDIKVQTDLFQRNLIRQTLLQCDGNWAATARQLNTDRSNLVRMAKRLGIEVQKQIVS